MTHAFRCPKSLVFSAFLAIFLMLAIGAKADNEIYGIHSEVDHKLTIFYGERPGNGIPCENAIINDTVRLYKKWNISGITKIVFDQSVESARPTDCSYWFYDMKTVESFEHLDYLNTSEVTNMHGMFSSCFNISNLDLRGFNTEKVIDMGSLFRNCNNLESLNISGWNTERVTTMSEMFSYLYKIETLDVSELNTANVNSMNYMFAQCCLVENLDLSNFNTSKVTDMSSMFYGCKGLKTLDVSGFDTERVTKMNSMFYGCSGLTSIDVSKLNTANVTDMSKMFMTCSELTNITFGTGSGDKFTTASVTNMSCMFYGCTGLTSIDVSKLNTENVTNMSKMFYSCKALANVTFSTGNGDKFNTGSVTDMSYMFYGCSGLTSIDISKLNTESVTNMDHMFNFSGLETIDVSKLNTANVTNMSYMFSSCNALANVTFSTGNGDKFNTGSVTDMSYMFGWCKALKDLNLSVFNTESVTTMASMFYYCENLETLNVSSFNTTNVSYMSFMFGGCKNLDNLNITGFNLENTTNISGMFNNCWSLSSIDLKNFDTKNVENMTGLFFNCQSLTKLDLSKFNTNKIANMSEMFDGCINLTSLDLTSFNTENVTNMSKMFNGCSKLISVFVSSEKWKTEKVNSHDRMFNGCTKLCGEKCAKLADFPEYNYNFNYGKEFANIKDLDKCLLIVDGYKIIFNSTLDGLNLDDDDRPKYTYKLNGVGIPIEDGRYVFTNLDFDFTPEVTAEGFDFVCWWGDTYTTLNGHETIPENDYSHQTITIPAGSRGNFYYTAVLQYPKNSEVTISEQPEFQIVMKYKYPIVFQKADINLAADIYSEGDTINPLGTPDLPYKGTFNGNSHTISGITTNAVVSSVADVGTLKVAQGSSMFGVLDNDAVVENLNIGNVLMNISFEDNDNLRTLDELTLPLFADVNAGQIKNCTFAPLLNIDDTNLKNKAKINLTLVGNNDNGEENTDDQALMENIAVFLPNVNLLYKTVGELMSGTTLTQKELMYRYWCYFANYMQAYKEDIECPTFNSFVKWWEGLTDSERAAFEVTIEFCDFDDDSSLSPLAESFIGWYTADAQNAYRVADKTIWVAYRIRQNAINGNEVAIVATQNLCKSPGKGRVHKVCSAPKGKSNKDGQLNPYDEEYMEYTLEEFASGIASYWLNHDGRGLTGNYNKMWSQSLLHPILATAKNGYILKLNVTKDDEAKSLTYPEYAKEGSTVKMYFTDKPAGVLVAGSPIADDAFMADYFKFEMPQTPDGESVVNVSVGFASVPTAIGNTEAPASAVRIIARGNSIVVENATNDIYVFDAIGHQITHQAPQAQNVIDVQNNGVYVVKCGTEAKKVVFHF